jgi:quercetin dioxygenase-like cupin family protein
MTARPRLALLAGAAILTTAAGAYAAGAAQQEPAQATRTVLAQAVDPTGARGRTLGVSRVRIPADTRLALHRHPGTQVAYIQKGTLTYSVRSGVANVYRGAADQSPRLVRRIAAGETARVRTGEWLIERPRMVHSGANEGDRPLVILLATLFRTGSPASIPVPEATRAP